MAQTLGYFALFLGLLRPALFMAGAFVAVAALISWAVRTRRVQPFSALARFSRDRLDPMFAPMERRILRAGGTPASAPWWTLAVVVVGGLVLLAVLQFLFNQLVLVMYALSGRGGPSLPVVLVSWTFSFLRFAILARVISSWVGGSAYSKWWRWSYITTEWLLGPLRRVIPTIGPIDISPLVAYFGLGLLQGFILGAIR